MTDQELHWIESYLKGKMNEEERLTFEQRMQTDADWKKQVSQVRSVMIAIRQSALDDKRNLLKEVESKEKNFTATGYRIRPLHRWISAAAVIFIGIILFFLINKPENEIKNQYLAENFDKFILHSTVRGNNDIDSLTKEQRYAYNLFAAKEFKKAIPELEKLWKTESDTLALFYLDVSNIVLKNKYDPQSTRLKSSYSEMINEIISN